MKTTLRDLRKASNKAAAEVAAALGVTIQAVYNYERGIRLIDIYSIIPLARLFDVTAEEIIEAQINSQRAQEDNRR